MSGFAAVKLLPVSAGGETAENIPAASARNLYEERGKSWFVMKSLMKQLSDSVSFQTSLAEMSKNEMKMTTNTRDFQNKDLE